MSGFNKIKGILQLSGLSTMVLALCLFNTSCKPSVDYTKQVAVLDSLSKSLHIADSSLTKVDTVTIKTDANNIMKDLELIKMAHKDSMSKGAAEIFRNFSGVRWQLETFMGRRTVMRIEMGKSMGQLNHLSHDLKNNLIKADSVGLFYGAEVKKAGLLIESEKASIEMLNGQLPLYNLIAPQADSLISLVKNHKEI